MGLSIILLITGPDILSRPRKTGDYVYCVYFVGTIRQTILAVQTVRVSWNGLNQFVVLTDLLTSLLLTLAAADHLATL